MKTDKSIISDYVEFKCPKCKSVNIKKSVNWGEFYDCECKNCNEKFLIPINSGLNYNAIEKILYTRNNKIIDILGLNKDNIQEFLPISAFIAFSILAIMATVSANKYLSVPFAVLAGLSLMFYVQWRIRSRSLVSN